MWASFFAGLQYFITTRGTETDKTHMLRVEKLVRATSDFSYEGTHSQFRSRTVCFAWGSVCVQSERRLLVMGFKVAFWLNNMNPCLRRWRWMETSASAAQHKWILTTFDFTVRTYLRLISLLDKLQGWRSTARCSEMWQETVVSYNMLKMCRSVLSDV